MSKDILLLGEFSTGKSAFLNMLLGVQLLPEQLDSTNLPIVKIQAGNPGGIGMREPGQKYPRNIESWSDIPDDWKDFDHAEVAVPGHPYLDKGLVFWDTPGINTTNSHHKQHLDEFVKSKSSRFLWVYYFVSGNLSSTSMEFLKQNRSLWDRLTIIVNIKEVMPADQSRQIESEVKKTVWTQVGNIPVHLLCVGDACEEFNERSEKSREGLSDYDLMRKWSEIKIDLSELLDHKTEDVIGVDIFDLVLTFADMPETQIEMEQEKVHLSNSKSHLDEKSRKPIKELDTSRMVLVEGGKFQMGNASGRKDEKPLHSVLIKSFYMDYTPITNIEYNNIIIKKQSKPVNSNPVVNVSWKDALKYCNILSRMEGLNVSYKLSRNAEPTWDPTANGYRLPTEAEWEYAARGGIQSRGFIYSGGNDLDIVGWYKDNSAGKLNPVGKKQPNELGLLDMSGNVSEWCLDYFGEKYYSTSEAENPSGPTAGFLWHKVVRGGSCRNMDHQCSVSVRSRFSPDTRRNDVGFRCVRNL
jgi:formylglycine-generating enzyme